MWITCSLLKGPSPGRSGGGDTPNEDEYSAALERLLDGCPACIRCSNQIGGMVREGGALCTGLWRGSRVVVVGARGTLVQSTYQRSEAGSGRPIMESSGGYAMDRVTYMLSSFFLTLTPSPHKYLSFYILYWWHDSLKWRSCIFG